MTLTYETVTLFIVAISALAAGAGYIGNKLQKISQKTQKISQKLELYVKQSECQERRKSCSCTAIMTRTLEKLCAKNQLQQH